MKRVVLQVLGEDAGAARVEAGRTQKRPQGVGALDARSRAQVRIAQRIAGLGSLGRERYVAIADWRRGKIAREAKALVTSAYAWALDGNGKKDMLKFITPKTTRASPTVKLTSSLLAHLRVFWDAGGGRGLHRGWKASW